MRFFTDKIYHVYNRGVEKRKIFMDNADYIRFLHNLYEFNDSARAIEYSRCDANVGGRTSHMKRVRNKLVEIFAFCLMPNHFHLLVKQLVDNGISLFLQKLGVGYTAAFNVKRHRSGVLFQGKTKAVLVEDENKLIHLPYYLHLNPLDLIFPGFKELGVSNWQEAEAFLKKYRWSSYLDYCDIDNFPSIISKVLRDNIWQNSTKYQRDMQDWLKEIEKNTIIIKKLIIE